MAAVQGGIKRGSSIGRLSRNSSFAAEVGKLARGSSLVVDIEAQAQRGAHAGHLADMPQSAPPRHSLPLQSVPSQGGGPLLLLGMERTSSQGPFHLLCSRARWQSGCLCGGLGRNESPTKATWTHPTQPCQGSSIPSQNNFWVLYWAAQADVHLHQHIATWCCGAACAGGWNR